MKKPTLITYIPKAGTMDFYGPAKPICVKPRRAWRKQINSWIATMPSCDSVMVEFNDDSCKFFRR
jgi:hypothetical protein